MADSVLQPFRCSADVRRFEPAELATLYSTDPDAALDRASQQNKDLGDSPLNAMADAVIGGGGDASARPAIRAAHVQFQPTRSSAAWRRCGTAGVLTRSIQMLYVQSLLLGHHPLSARELSLLKSAASPP